MGQKRQAGGIANHVMGPVHHQCPNATTLGTAGLACKVSNFVHYQIDHSLKRDDHTQGVFYTETTNKLAQSKSDLTSYMTLKSCSNVLQNQFYTYLMDVDITNCNMVDC